MADLGGVEFLMQLNAKLDQAVKMTKALTATDAALIKAEAAMKKTEKSAGVLNRVLGAIAERAGQFARDMLAHFSALAAFDFAKGIISGAIGIGKSMLMAAAGAEKTSRAFEFLFGKDLAPRMEDAADAIAKKTQFDDDKVKAGFQELAAAGVKPLQIIDAIAIAADAAARTGNEGAFDGIIAAVKQMQVLGRAPRGLGELGLAPGAGKMIEKEIKRGTSALDAFLKVVDKTADKPIFSAALLRGQGLDVLFHKLEDLPSQFGQKLAGTAGYEKIKKAAGALLEAFDPDGPRGKQIIKALETALSKIADQISKIDVDRLAQTMVDLFDKMPAMIETAAKAISGLVNAFLELHSAVKGFQGTATPQEKQTTGGKIGSALSLRPLEDELGRLMGLKEKSVKGVLMSVLTVGHLMERVGLTGGEGMAAGVQASTPQVAASAQNMAAAAPAAAKAELEAHSPSRVFQDIGSDTAAGFALGVTGAVADVRRTMADTFSPMSLAGGAGFGMAAAAAVTSRGGGEAAGPSFQAYITVNIGSGAGDKREVAEASVEAMEQSLEAWMVQMAGAGGAT